MFPLEVDSLRADRTFYKLLLPAGDNVTVLHGGYAESFQSKVNQLTKTGNS